MKACYHCNAPLSDDQQACFRCHATITTKEGLLAHVAAFVAQGEAQEAAMPDPKVLPFRTRSQRASE